jgi:hypothetical protein
LIQLSRNSLIPEKEKWIECHKKHGRKLIRSRERSEDLRRYIEPDGRDAMQQMTLKCKEYLYHCFLVNPSQQIFCKTKAGQSQKMYISPTGKQKI